MPRARKRAESLEEVVEEQHDEEMQDSGVALQFDEPLTWKAGKPIPVGDLMRRMTDLYTELQSMEQGDADRETLVPKAQELANTQLLDHRDKGVKAWALACIVEMFKLLAPDAPYKSGQLKKIFEIFVDMVVPALASPTDPYNQQHQAILHSLTTIKSIVLITDIPGSDALLVKLFGNCFDVMAGTVKGGHGEQISKNVEYHMTNMLSTLIDECQSLPSGVVDIILAQFLRADPGTYAAHTKKGADAEANMPREMSPAYRMAQSVCNMCADKMTRYVGQYFSSVLIDASDSFSAAKVSKPRGKKRTHDESEDESDDGLLTPLAGPDWREVEKAHRLLRELWRSSPDIIRNIIPQMEAEIGAEAQQLRALAVETMGDMISGIGAAGPPPPPVLDPAAYPSQSVVSSSTSIQYDNSLLAPRAPHAFAAIYPGAYQGFIDRHRDKNAQVRSAWATAAGRVLSTNGGSKGLDASQESQLLRYMSDMLCDNDEKVRLAAVEALATFDYNTLIQKLSISGGVEVQGSLLANLSDRIKDRKHLVRVAAMELLGRIWGVASGAIAEGSQRLRELLGSMPGKILEAFYINDKEVNALIQRVMYESLLPMNYPPIKSKPVPNGDSQRVADSQTAHAEADPDALRAERILVLIRDLDEKAKKVFFSLQQRHVSKAKYLERYLNACEAVYGSNAKDDDGEGKDVKGKDVKGKDAKSNKKELEAISAALAGMMPDAEKATLHLRRFAKHHDRRSYHLIRLCYSPDSDYRKIMKAMKEMTKRIEDVPSGVPEVLETLLPLVQSVSNLVNNRSHVPAVMHFARTDEKELGGAAHEYLKELSSSAPDIFKVHVRELCDGLRKQAPTPTMPNQPSAVSELKACAGFATRYPDEMPKDREFYKAMSAFARYGTPPEAAKHAVTIIAHGMQKREMYVKDVLNYALENFEYGAECFLSRLAALSQLRLVAYPDTEDKADEIMELAVTKILGQVRTEDDDSLPAWTDEIDDDLCAKLWALKILVNGLRGLAAQPESNEMREEINRTAPNVYRLLNTLIEKGGELTKSASTARNHKAHLRLAAANQILKLSCNRILDAQLSPRDFDRLTIIAQDALPDVRAGFVRTLKKYLGQGKLPNRFYALVFLYAYDPSRQTLESTSTWLKARVAMGAKGADIVMESVIARLLSLLAHHQDFGTEPDELAEFVEYIMFYLKNVATQANLPLIYAIVQRVKTVQDGVHPDMSERLWVMSDLAEATIRAFRDVQGWSLQIVSTKPRMPAGIFASMPSHAMAQEVAEKRYLPDELAENIEDLVKASLKPKKRKAEGSASKQTAKRVKGDQATAGAEKEKKLPVRKAPKVPKATKTPKKKATSSSVPSSAVRKSARHSNASKAVNYVEEDDSEDDEELEKWQAGDADQDEVEEGDVEAVEEEVVVDEEDVRSSKSLSPSPPSVKKRAPAKTKRAAAAKPTARSEPAVDDGNEEMGDADEADSPVLEATPVKEAASAKGRPSRAAKAQAQAQPAAAAAKATAKSRAVNGKAKKAAVRQPSQRNTRAAKSKREKDIMGVPSDSESGGTES